MKIQRVKFLLTFICVLAAGICYSCSGRTNQSEPEGQIVTAVLHTEETSGDRDVQRGLISAETEALEMEPGNAGEESGKEPGRQGESVRFYVHICGQVRNPGVYEMEPGSRLFQAVELAGGFTEEAARDYLNMGYYLGVGGVVTFKNARVLKEVVEYAPLDRILVETDCPYLAPAPFRGKRNMSSLLSYVLDTIAALKGVSREEAERATWENAVEMYRIGKR